MSVLLLFLIVLNPSSKICSHRANDTIKHAGEALRSFTKGSRWNFRGSNDSLANAIDREIAARHMGYVADLKLANVHDIAFSGELDAKIIGAEEQIRKGLPVDPKWGTDAIKIAQINEKHTENSRQDMNANGAWIPKNDDRLFAMRYDHNRVAGAGGLKWGSPEAQKFYVDEYMKRMDWSKAFSGDFANATDAARRERVGDIWQQFKADTHFKLGSQAYGPGKTYGLQPHIEMVLKTPQDSYEIWKQFGRGDSLAEAHVADLKNLGQQIGVMKMLGVRAEKTLRAAVSEIHTELMSKSGTFEEVSENKRQAALLEQAFQDEMQNTWRLITDTVAHPNDNAAYRFLSGMRLMLNTTAYGFSLPTLIGDLNLRAVRLNAQGRGSWLGNLGKATADQFTPKGLTAAEQAQFYAQAGISLEVNSRPTDLGVSEHRVYDGVRKGAGIIRSATLHSVWDNSNRTGSFLRDYMHYHDLKGTEWGDLHPGEQATLNSFGIDRIGWDVMRKAKSIDLAGGWGKGLSPDAIREMDPNEFKSLSIHQNPSAVTLKRMRDRLADQYRNLIGENANRNVSAPSTARNALLRIGKYYDPNTVHGWAMAQAASLKGWAINYMSEHLGRGILSQYTEHVPLSRIMQDLMTGKNTQGLKITAQYMVGGVALAYASNTLRQLAMGKAPVNPVGTDASKPITEQPWFDVLSEAIARGAAGTYGDFFFGQTGNPETSHPLTDKLTKLILGPEGEFYLKVGDLLEKSTADAIKSGGYETSAIRGDEQKAFGIGYHALPPSNLLATKWALDYYFFNALSEQINPGYQQRLQGYAKRQNTYYLAGSPGAQ